MPAASSRVKPTSAKLGWVATPSIPSVTGSARRASRAKVVAPVTRTSGSPTIESDSKSAPDTNPMMW